MNQLDGNKSESQRGPNGRFLKGNEFGKKEAEAIKKEEFKQEIAEYLKRPVESRIVEFITETAFSDEKNKMEIVKIILKKYEPKEDRSESVTPDVIEVLDIHLKYKMGKLVEAGKKADSATPLLDKIAQEREDLNKSEGYKPGE